MSSVTWFIFSIDVTLQTIRGFLLEFSSFTMVLCHRPSVFCVRRDDPVTKMPVDGPDFPGAFGLCNKFHDPEGPLKERKKERKSVIYCFNPLTRIGAPVAPLVIGIAAQIVVLQNRPALKG